MDVQTNYKDLHDKGDNYDDVQTTVTIVRVTSPEWQLMNDGLLFMLTSRSKKQMCKTNHCINR